MHIEKIIVVFTFSLFALHSFSQSRIDSPLSKVNPEKLSSTIKRKVERLQAKIIAKSEKALDRLEREEEKICKTQLATKDSLSKTKLADVRIRYQSLRAKLREPSSIVPEGAGRYIPHLDTLKTAFKFLDQNCSIKNVRDALSKMESFEDKMQQAEEIKRFIHERSEQLRQQLEELGLLRELKKFHKEVYYYGEQIKEYREILSDPTKIEKKTLELLSKTKVFQDFMRKHSMLASLFRMPGDPNDPNYLASLTGLQTRVQLNNLIQQQIAAGGPNAQAQFQQNIQQAQTQLNELKNRLMQFGRGGSSDDIMPEGFKPNSQKTKSFLKRLEYGTNVQVQKAHYYFPATSDLGLSLGYKLNDKSIIGIGASYKVGLGQGWNRMEFSSQGAGLRSYVDWKLKGSFWITGGYEMNYRTEFNNIDPLHDLSLWQQSGLLGLSKVIDVKSKFFKKTKLQLLWDFLSYQQVPKTQSIIFRVGYNLK